MGPSPTVRAMVVARDVEYTADGSTMVGRVALPGGADITIFNPDLDPDTGMASTLVETAVEGLKPGSSRA